MSVRFAAAILAVLVSTSVAAADRTFGGNECTDDCTGHAQGYRWAEDNGLDNESDCPLVGNRTSFYEGCVTYTEDHLRGADEDDDGNEVGGW